MTETLLEPETFAQDIKRSRFRAVAGPAADEEAARAFIGAHGDADAGHNCWAFRCGAISRFSDDGEPGGTAGRPILQAIEGQGLDRVAVVVSRWFGGILLGSGGLVRAYGGTAAACLRASRRRPLVAMSQLAMTCGFADEPRVRARLAAVPGATIAHAGFTAGGVSLAIVLPQDEITSFVAFVADLTRGQAIIGEPVAIPG